MLNVVPTNPRDRALVLAVALGASFALPTIASAARADPIANSGRAHLIAPHPIANSGLHAYRVIHPIPNS